MFFKRLGALSVIAGCVLVAGGCAAGSGAQPSPGSTGQAGSGSVRIATAFYPLQFVASEVAGNHADVFSLTAPGTEPHDLELTPRQVAEIGDAAAVLYISGFQPAVDEAVAETDGSDSTKTLDMATVVKLVPAAAGDAEAPADGHSSADHSAAGHEEGHESTGQLDPHIWLDPQNMIKITEATVTKLAAVDPANAADYKASGAELIKKLEALDADYSSGLKDCRRRDFITSHAAFGYLATRYHLNQVSINGISPDADPSPARIAEVQQLAKKLGVTTIFTETLVSPAVADAIAGDLKLKTDVLDPVEAVTDQSRGTDYLSIMQSNLAALKKANECS